MFKSVFQSTLRRTERPLQKQSCMVVRYFNPRSDERSDYNCGCNFVHNLISIHAPTNGATLPFSQFTTVLLISIHAPTNGATLHRPLLCHHKRFQSTLRRTERREPSVFAANFSDFNPRSDERSDTI